MKCVSAKQNSLYSLALLFYALSFFGWCGETIYFLIYLKGGLIDRGFLTLPFCTIYGSTVLLVYFLLGTPHGGRLRPLFEHSARLSPLPKAGARSLLYLLYYFLVMLPPALVELAVGVLFSKTLHAPLWDYGHHTFHLFGSICLSQTLLWGGLFTFGMAFVWDPLFRLAQRIPFRIKKIAVLLLTAALLCDFILNLFFLLRTGRVLHLYGLDKNFP